MTTLKAVVAFAILFIAVHLVYMRSEKQSQLPVVAIANFGPHASLNASIFGIKKALERKGFIENKTVHYELSDVGFDPSLIPQMIAQLQGFHPKVMVVITTPVAQYAKGVIKDCPLIYAAVTDPVASGLIRNADQADHNMTGSSDKQDLTRVLAFAKNLIPSAKTVGLLYATSESNDTALVSMIRKAAHLKNMNVLAVAVNETRDIPIAMQQFKNKVDFIYVGASGPIQPSLPVIAVQSNKMDIPVLNVEGSAVKNGLVLASFGVDYYKVGMNAGNLVSQVLQGRNVSTLAPIYPSDSDYIGVVHHQAGGN